jgi:hypothetical protein
MRSGQQFWSGLCAHTGEVTEDVADAVDRGSEPGLPKPLGKPHQRAHMRLGERRPVNAGLVGADATERIEIGKNPAAIDIAIVKHEQRPSIGGDHARSLRTVALN